MRFENNLHRESPGRFVQRQTPLVQFDAGDLDLDEVFVLVRNRHTRILFFYGYTWLPALDDFDAMPRPALVTAYVID